MMQTKYAPDWKVLLLGGHSGTGKTIVSRRLAQRFGVALAEVDDFRLVLERMSTPEELPTLHNLIACASRPDIQPQSLSQALIEAAETISYALEIVVANHVNTNTPIVLEGDGITPAFSSRRVYANLETSDLVRAVFLIEQDEKQLFQNAVERKRGFHELELEHQQRLVRASWLYGQWLQREAMRHGVPGISPRPWETLEERIIQVVGIW
jgi:2-phosphoglycerate kinase